MEFSKKSSIRSELRAKREALAPKLWQDYSNQIQKTILQSRIYRECDILMAYADINNEVGTLTLCEDALIAGKEVYFPKVLENFNEARMEFYRVNNTNELTPGFQSICEPLGEVTRAFDYNKSKDCKILMVVPGIAFDREGNRLGYGKGYYDNFLRNKEKIMKVGICFSMQVLDSVPYTKNDLKVNYIVSELTGPDEIEKFVYPEK
ncbi:MAG: 5-formyltetrahydrofolate cyclo-ligase [Lachnospiraceae bacterium]|nr:5-formyltetrahydrofolate cyclo-ligase [Lachnospiraceae bacterium]